ncbi:MAG: hypothetical protein LBS54_05380 [Dysgonamonadaceae bacterium]|jgi:hypothetical protein|nr:hypothetical protein [Dysgonamonadaceae bacterium]
MRRSILTMTALFMLSAGVVKAQVTIGATTDPHSFSILELVSGGERGLRLPQMTTEERDALTATLTGNSKAQGLRIFNTTTKCVETWNGTKWIQSCAPTEGEDGEEPVPYDPANDSPCVQIFPPTCGNDCTLPGGSLCFMNYNLGANPLYDTPKKQMRYLAETEYDDSDQRGRDARINGGLYQWGRRGHLYALNAANYTRYASYENVVDGFTTDYPNAYDVIFYAGHNKWYEPDYDALEDPQDPAPNDLWGNGFSFLHSFGNVNNGGVYYDNELPGNDPEHRSGYFQNTNRIYPDYDPCPTGFRLPTQDEWERICNYDCNPSEPGLYYIETNPGGHDPINSGLIWIPVVCGNNKCVPSLEWEEAVVLNVPEEDKEEEKQHLPPVNVSSGYAVYEESVWNDAITTGVYKDWGGGGERTAENFPAGQSLHYINAPNPLLFLPAAGVRGNDRGGIGGVGIMGKYWSSSIGDEEGAASIFCGFYGGTYGGTVEAGSSDMPNNGMSIRCVATSATP